MDQTTIPTPSDESTEGAAPPEGFVTISREELEALRLRAETAEDAERSDPQSRSRRAGDVEESNDGASRARDARLTEEIGVRDRRLAELERAYRSAVRDREVATVLAGRPLVSGAASQLIKLWREELDVYDDGGVYRVSARDGRPVAQAVNEWLASPEYSHFCLPPSRGGAGARDASRPASAPSGTGAPKTLGEAVVMRWRDEANARPNNLLKPIGLRRHR